MFQDWALHIRRDTRSKVRAMVDKFCCDSETSLISNRAFRFVRVQMVSYIQFFCILHRSAGIESVSGSEDGMSEAICNACEMIVFWMQSEFNPNKTTEGTLEYVDRVSERLS